MKRAAFFLILGLAVCLCGVPRGFAAVKYKQYTDEKQKFSIKYPDGYTVKTVGSAVVFSAPLSGKRDTFAESFNIVVVGVADYPGTMQSFYQRSKKSLQETMPQLRIIDEGMETISGRPAFRLNYTSLQNDTVFEFMQSMVGYYGLVYVLTYTAMPESYEDYLPVINEMIESFSFID
jgi:eukaryotic-like serine/threonine-protein kinase